MGEDVSYADRWSHMLAGAVDEIEEDEARRRHETGEAYTAILGDPDHPDAYLEVGLRSGFVAVHLLDDDKQDDVIYVFSREDGEDNLFLEQATWREFTPEGEVARGESYTFKRDGTIYLEAKDYLKREAERGEKKDDVSGNWEPVPEFGRYESIARRER